MTTRPSLTDGILGTSDGTLVDKVQRNTGLTRWARKASHGRGLILQHAWQDMVTGEIEWRDVPVVDTP